MELLKQVGYAVTEFPSDFMPHKQIKKVYEARRNMIDTGEGLDWGMAETLAYATLLSEGNHVRLSGQDVERGTFSHRCVRGAWAGHACVCCCGLVGVCLQCTCAYACAHARFDFNRQAAVPPYHQAAMQLPCSRCCAAPSPA